MFSVPWGTVGLEPAGLESTSPLGLAYLLLSSSRVQHPPRFPSPRRYWALRGVPRSGRWFLLPCLREKTLSSVLWRSWGVPLDFWSSVSLPETGRPGCGLDRGGGACWPYSPSACSTMSMVLSIPITIPLRYVQYFSYLSSNSLCTCRCVPPEPSSRYFFRLWTFYHILRIPLTSLSFSSSNFLRSPLRTSLLLLVSSFLCSCAVSPVGCSSSSTPVSGVPGSSALPSLGVLCVTCMGALARPVGVVGLFMFLANSSDCLLQLLL